MSSLVIQKNKEKIKELVRQTILDTIRDNIPIEQLLRAYLDETTELMDEPKKKKEDKSLRFSETNMAMSTENEESVYVPPEREPEEEKLKLEDVPVTISFEDLAPKPEVKIDPIVEITELVEPVKAEPEIILDIVELGA